MPNPDKAKKGSPYNPSAGGLSKPAGARGYVGSTAQRSIAPSAAPAKRVLDGISGFVVGMGSTYGKSNRELVEEKKKKDAKQSKELAAYRAELKSNRKTRLAEHLANVSRSKN